MSCAVVAEESGRRTRRHRHIVSGNVHRLVLPRFRGPLTLWGGGIHHAEIETAPRFHGGRLRRPSGPWPSSSTCSAAESPLSRGRAGRWPGICAPNSCSTHSTGPSSNDDRTPSSTAQRPGVPVHLPRLRRALLAMGRGPVDGLGRGVLRQRHGRELLRHPRMRVARPHALPRPPVKPGAGSSPGAQSHLRVHRGMGSPASSPPGPRSAIPHRLREEPPGSGMKPKPFSVH